VAFDARLFGRTAFDSVISNRLRLPSNGSVAYHAFIGANMDLNEVFVTENACRSLSWGLAPPPPVASHNGYVAQTPSGALRMGSHHASLFPSSNVRVFYLCVVSRGAERASQWIGEKRCAHHRTEG